MTTPQTRKGTKSDPISSSGKSLIFLAGYKSYSEVLGTGIANDTETLAFQGVIGFPISEGT